MTRTWTFSACNTQVEGSIAFFDTLKLPHFCLSVEPSILLPGIYRAAFAMLNSRLAFLADIRAIKPWLLLPALRRLNILNANALHLGSWSPWIHGTVLLLVIFVRQDAIPGVSSMLPPWARASSPVVVDCVLMGS